MDHCYHLNWYISRLENVDVYAPKGSKNYFKNLFTSLHELNQMKKKLNDKEEHSYNFIEVSYFFIKIGRKGTNFLLK